MSYGMERKGVKRSSQHLVLKVSLFFTRAKCFSET